ncbi:MOSC domain-containing protein [Nitrospira sp. M1]
MTLPSEQSTQLRTRYEAGLAHIRLAPQDAGWVHMIVGRPEKGKRQIVDVGELDVTNGLAGDNWKIRGSSRTTDGLAHPHTQLTIMNSRVIALIAGDKDRWPLAGNQVYVDLDLHKDNLPPGTQLVLGTAVIEVTDQPLTGCKKFSARFGVEAVKFVNSAIGKTLQLRGINSKVIRSGRFRTGDIIKKI